MDTGTGVHPICASLSLAITHGGLEQAVGEQGDS